MIDSTRGGLPVVRELRLVYSHPATGPLPKVGQPSDAATLLRPFLALEAVEVCVALLLNARHRVIGIHVVGRGTLDSCIVHPRDVFKAALLANAAGVIVCHNHPSGDPTPSPEDRTLCARLRDSGRILGVHLLDFLIVTDDGHYSFKETGL